MAGEHILFVCFDAGSVMARERRLLAQGYQIRTVLGLDGLMAATDLAGLDFILLGDEGSLQQQERAISYLMQERPEVPIIVLYRGLERPVGANYWIPMNDPDTWFDAVVDYIHRPRKFA